MWFVSLRRLVSIGCFVFSLLLFQTGIELRKLHLDKSVALMEAITTNPHSKVYSTAMRNPSPVTWGRKRWNSLPTFFPPEPQKKKEIICEPVPDKEYWIEDVRSISLHRNKKNRHTNLRNQGSESTEASKSVSLFPSSETESRAEGSWTNHPSTRWLGHSLKGTGDVDSTESACGYQSFSTTNRFCLLHPASWMRGILLRFRVKHLNCFSQLENESCP